MKKIFVSIISIIVAMNIYCQTLELEKLNLERKFSEKEITPEAYRQLASEWRKFIEQNSFPEMPYNEVKKEIEFVYIKEFRGITKEVIYQRVHEWAALTFGSHDVVVDYEDYNAGKIIIKGWGNIVHKKDIWFFGKQKDLTQKKCYMTYLFTIVDGKLKAQATNIDYEYKKGGYTIGNTYYPEYTVSFSIHDIYPITNLKSSLWEENTDLLLQTKNKIERSFNNLELYVKDYKNDYNF